MRWKSIWVVALPLLGALALLVAGCGGSKKTTTTSTSTALSTTTNATTAASSTTTTAAPSTGTVSSGLGALASAANCGQLSGIESAFVAALSGTGSDLQQKVAVLQQFAAKTPAEIRPDFEIVAAAFAKIAGALKGTSLGSGGVPTAAEITKLEQLGAQLKDPQLSKAETAIGQWAAKNCHP